MLVHIEEHQDKNILGPFTRDAVLNIEADQLVCTKLTSYTTGPQQFHILWSQGVCYTGAQQVEKIGEHHMGSYQWPHHESILGIRRDLMEGIWNHIDWESIGWAMQEVPVN